MSQFLAIFMGLLGYAILNIGLVLEKHAADSLPAIENTSAVQNMKNFLGHKEWLIGFILTNLHWLFLFLALSMAPLSLISPLLGFGLVILTIFSHFYLHEKIRHVEMIGIGIIIGGIVLIGITSVEETKFTIENIFGLFGAPASLVYLCGISVMAGIACAYSISSKYKFAPAIIFGFAAGVGAGLGGTFTKGVSSGVDNILGAVGNGIWWIMLLIMLAANTISMVLLQIGFQKGKAVIVAPIYSVLGMILPVLSGIIILGEWSGQDLLNVMILVVGLIIIAIGIIILSFYGEKKKRVPNEIDKD